MRTITRDQFKQIQDARYALLTKLVAKSLGQDYESQVLRSGDPMVKGSPHKFDFAWDESNNWLHGGISGSPEPKTLYIEYGVFIRGIDANIMYSFSSLVNLPKTLARYGFKPETFVFRSGATYEVPGRVTKGREYLGPGFPTRHGMPYTGYLYLQVLDTEYAVVNNAYKPQPDELEVLAEKARLPDDRKAKKQAVGVQ